MKTNIEKLERLKIKRGTLENLLARLPKHGYLDPYDDEWDRAHTHGQNSMIDEIRQLIHKVMIEYTPSHPDQIEKEKNM